MIHSWSFYATVHVHDPFLITCVYLETPSFVDVLFRSLDSESYLTGSDDRDTTPPLKTGNRSNVDNGRGVMGVVSSVSPSLGGPERIVTDHRRVSEDVRHREVRGVV